MSSQEQLLPADSQQVDEAVELTLVEKEKPIADTARNAAIAASVISEEAEMPGSITSATNTRSELQPSSAAKTSDDTSATAKESGPSTTAPEMEAVVDVHLLDESVDKNESAFKENSSGDDDAELNRDGAEPPDQRSDAAPTTDGSTASGSNTSTEKSNPSTRPSTNRSTATGLNTDSISVNVEGDNNPANVLQIERPRVQIYGSTVSGNRIYKRQAKELFMMLEANEIDFEFICIAADEKAKNYMRRKARNNMTIPQIYVDTEFRGFFDDAFKANESDELYEWLGLDDEPLEY
ncbi:hypothetical protein H4R24_005134 [Coemansia sp. RSA 988]|nr:hypothetical protein H4R24_005134 [Coemansia sp. RSA 988]